MLAQQSVDFGPIVAALTALIAVAGGVAVTVAKIVDFIRNLFGAAEKSVPSWVWNAIAFGVGIAVALGWGINLFDAIVKTIPALAESDVLSGTGGTILTGMVIGGLAGFWHDKMAQWAAAHKSIPQKGAA